MNNFEYRKIKLSFLNNFETHQFLNGLRKASVRLYNISVEGKQVTCEIRWQDLRKVRRVRRRFRVKMEITRDDVRPILQLNGRTIIGLLLLLIIPFCSQFYTWGIEVKADTIERQVEVERLLDKIVFPVRTNVLPSEHQLRQQLLLKLDDVAWVHIEKDGAKLKVAVEEAPKIAKDQVETGRALIAKQGGVVTHYMIESGVKQFMLNGVVEKGEVLVVGEVQVSEEVQKTIPVRGKVFVDFWRTVSFTMPKEVKLAQQQSVKWRVGPLQKGEVVQQELLHWTWLPDWANIRQVAKQKVSVLPLDEQQLDTIILPLLQQKVLASLSEDATIRSEKLLHVTFDNDTVKGQVLYLVNENVAVLSSSD